MIQRYFFVLMCLVPTASVFAQEADRETVRIWPDTVPGEAELSDEFRKKVTMAESKNTPDRVFGVTTPTMSIYKVAAEQANGMAVLVCPGGGYNVLAWDHEGRAVAEWLNS